MKKALLITTGGLLSLTLISGALLSSIKASAESASTSVIVPFSYCGLDASATNNTPHTATINNGTYKENIGTTTFNVVCGDNSGFSVYAVGYSNEDLGNNKLLATINGTLSPTNDIETGTAISGDKSNWAMKATPVSGAYTPTIENGFNNYSNIPTTYTKIATFGSATNTTTSSAFSATYRVYINRLQPNGKYMGKVRFALVHPASEVPFQPQPVVTAAGKIGYVPNASGVVDTMGDQEYTGFTSTVNNNTTPVAPNKEATLWASNFKRPGYGFAGWNTAYDYSGTTYGPNETIITPSDLNTKGLTLYAIWVKSAGNLQDWNGCSLMSNGQVTALTDTRDQNTYAVAKLADGKCWMIENLQLGGTNPVELDSTTTDLPNGKTYTLPVFSSNTDIEKSVNANNTINPVANMTSTDVNIVSYGNYYGWVSLTAGTETAYPRPTSANAAGSICPKGWSLPIGGEAAAGGSFSALDIALGGTGADQSTAEASNRWRTYPNNFIYSGDVWSGYDSPNFNTEVRARGASGNYWTSTVDFENTDGAMLSVYGLRIGRTSIYVRYFDVEYEGFESWGYSVRCIAR